jgi:hypothetical protein
MHLRPRRWKRDECQFALCWHSGISQALTHQTRDTQDVSIVGERRQYRNPASFRSSTFEQNDVFAFRFRRCCMFSWNTDNICAPLTIALQKHEDFLNTFPSVKTWERYIICKQCVHKNMFFFRNRGDIQCASFWLCTLFNLVYKRQFLCFCIRLEKVFRSPQVTHGICSCARSLFIRSVFEHIFFQNGMTDETCQDNT